MLYEVITVDKENLLQYVAPQDLKAYGLIPEIIGRLPVLTYLDPLDREALKKILTEPKNAIIMDGNGRWAQAKKRPRLFGRITSYNVCYTKLLR